PTSATFPTRRSSDLLQERVGNHGNGATPVIVKATEATEAQQAAKSDVTTAAGKVPSKNSPWPETFPVKANDARRYQKAESRDQADRKSTRLNSSHVS